MIVFHWLFLMYSMRHVKTLKVQEITYHGTQKGVIIDFSPRLGSFVERELDRGVA